MSVKSKPLRTARSTSSRGGNQSLADFVYRHLRDAVRSGRYSAGDRLREADLAAQLSVSRTPIREAIRRLVSDGLVEVAASRGVMFIELDKQQVRELYVLRESLEGTAAGLAAMHASEGEIDLMQELLKESSATKLSPERMARMNSAFHQAIHDAAHNRYLTQALNQLYDSLALLPGTTFEYPGRSAIAQREHLAILKAIRSRDPEAAEQHARRHIQAAAMVRIKMMFAAT
jgi:DNA-binding GntR family transcriptional regulator